MTLSFPRYGPGLSPMMSILSREAQLGDAWNQVMSLSSAAYPAANKAFYFAFQLPVIGTAYKLWWANGTTASTNNIQVGVYADDGSYKPGAALIRGTATLASGASLDQFDDITNTQLGTGLVWFAVWCNGTTTHLWQRQSTGLRGVRIYSEASLTGGLPATATPAGAEAFAFFPIFGVQFRASP